METVQDFLGDNFIASMLDDLADGITVQDLNLRVVYINKAQRRTYGHDVIGKHCYEAYKQRVAPCPECPLKEAIKSGEPCRGNSKVIDAEGNELHRELISTPIRDRQGQIIGGVQIVRDITGQEKTRRLLAAADEKLRAPLKSIAGCESSLFNALENDLSAEQARDLRTIYESSRELLDLIENLNLDPLDSEPAGG